MATLKEIADQIADALNRPFDDMLKERVKAIFKQEMAVLIRQQLNKDGLDSSFLTRYSAECIPITASDSSMVVGVTLNGTAYRTKNKVATPIRYHTDDPFTYVGDINGIVPFIYTKLAELRYANYMPAIEKAWHIRHENINVPRTPIRYDYRNNYIYIYFNLAVVHETYNIMIEGVHSTNSFLDDMTEDSASNNTVNVDDYEYPAPYDLIQLAKERLLKGELSIIDDKDKILSRHLDNN